MKWMGGGGGEKSEATMMRMKFSLRGWPMAKIEATKRGRAVPRLKGGQLPDGCTENPHEG